MSLVWSMPIVAVMMATLSGRLRATGAALLGLALAAAIALCAPPHLFTVLQALDAAARGLWLGVLVGAIILGGLFFRDAAAAGIEHRSDARAPGRSARAACFEACFLIGPFAETATGVGVGQVATTAALRPLGLAPLHVASLALFSQVLVPWGAMANGTIVGASFSGLAPTVLAQHSAILTVPLLAAWLALFWIFARRAGLKAAPTTCLSEAVWVAGIAASVVLANRIFEPEIAGLAALAPPLALRFALEARGDPVAWRTGLRTALPYGVLITGLVLIRHGPPAVQALGERLMLKPFPDAPGFNVLTHPVTWFAIVGLFAARRSGRLHLVSTIAGNAWRQGRRSVLNGSLFLIMAQLMARSGVAEALARALHDLLGPATPLFVPVVAGALGFMTGSTNAANGLVMPAQVAFATEAGLDVAWIAAVQNTAAAAMTMLSPLRVAMACALAGSVDLERSIYARAWPLGASAIAILVAACALLIVVSS